MKLLPITITGKTLSTTASPAVKGDKDIDALSIAVPITYEGTNLAQDAWHIRFKLPGGTVHIDPLTDGVPDDAEAPTTLTFTYPMQGLIVSQSGNVALQIINVPADGSSIFQTLPGPSITVSSTLEGPPSADYNAAPWGAYLAQYEAIRDETKQYRDEAVDGAASALESASNAQESATQAAGSATDSHNSELAAKGYEEGAGLIKGAIDSLVASASFQAVVGVADDIPAVAEVAEHIPAVAGAAGSIPTVAGVADELALLAPVADEIAALALIVADITSVSGVKADVSAVAAKLVEVQAVYAKLQAIEAVAGRTTEIDALYAQLDTIAAKANQADMDAVEDRLDTLEGTGEGSVADDIAKYAVKLTKMPDGATAVYSQDAWATVDGWTGISPSIIANPGNLRSTSVGNDLSLQKDIAGIDGKVCVMRISASNSFTLKVLNQASAMIHSDYISTTPTVIIFMVPVGTTRIRPYVSAPIPAGLWFEIDWVWIGDYSYLENSLSTEASRIANQLGDTAGVGTKASGTITSNGTNVSDGDTVTIAGKTYTFKTTLTPVEGEVRIGPTYDNSILYLAWAINRYNSASHDGVLYKIASAHTLVSASPSGAIVAITARIAGILGNSITLAKSASTLTLSGSTLTGGTDDVGEKLRTQIASLNGQWITPTLVNGWTIAPSQFCEYRKDGDGIVHIRGVLIAGTISDFTQILTIPAGYRPRRGQIIALVRAANGIPAFLYHYKEGNSLNISSGQGFVTGQTYDFEASWVAYS